MLWQAIKAARDLGRVHDIAAVLIRYGFGDLVRRVGMARALERAGKKLHWRAPSELAGLAPPARVCRVLEELGPTFVKMGQLLATRVDLFPPEWIAEFEKLQDEVPAQPFEDIREQLEEDLGQPPEAVFAQLQTTPLASGSLAQVYKASLHDGTPVILKVRRPGIRAVVEADLRLLGRLAEIVEGEAPDLARYHLKDVVRQLNRSLRHELDFAAEGRSAERIAGNFADRPEIVIPRVHWQWTCERLNVQALIEGIAGRRLAAVDAAGLDRHELARRGAEAVLKMMLEDGLFHADPHPGNLIYLPENRIAFIDFGMIGRLSEQRRFELAMLLNGLVHRDADTAAEILLDWGASDADSALLSEEVDAFIDHYYGVPLKSIRLGRMLSDLVGILREHRIALPADLTLMIKAFVTLEGLGRQLDPDFDMAGVTLPFMRRIMVLHHSPASMTRRGRQALMNTFDVLGALPRDLRRLLRSARRGRLNVQIEVSPLKQFGDQVDRAFTRLTLGIVTAALIVGSSIAMTVGQDSDGRGLNLFATLGFVGAVIGGLAVLISIWRGGRH